MIYIESILYTTYIYIYLSQPQHVLVSLMCWRRIISCFGHWDLSGDINLPSYFGPNFEAEKCCLENWAGYSSIFIGEYRWFRLILKGCATWYIVTFIVLYQSLDVSSHECTCHHKLESWIASGSLTVFLLKIAFLNWSINNLYHLTMAIFYVAKCYVIPVVPSPGFSDSIRDGNKFGPDVVQNFLRVNNFEMRPAAGSWEKSAMGWYPWWCMNRNKLKRLLYRYYTQHLYNIKKWLHGMPVGEALISFGTSPQQPIGINHWMKLCWKKACDPHDLLHLHVYLQDFFRSGGPIKHHFLT